MISSIENYLNCRQHFRDNIPMIMEYFIRYYGEDKRKEIEDKFSHVLYLAYRKPQTTESFLQALSEEVSNEIIDKYFTETKTIFTKKELFDYSFSYVSIQPITKYQEFCKLYQLGKEGRLEIFKQNAMDNLNRFLPELTKEEYEEMIRTQKLLPKYQNVNPIIKDSILYYINVQNSESKINRDFRECEKILHKIDPNITIDNFGDYKENEQIKMIDQLVLQIPEMIKEYEQRMSAYSVYQKEAEEDKKYHDELESTFYIRYIEENLDLVSPEDLEVFRNYKQNPKSSMLNKRLYATFGYSLSSNQALNAFSKEAEEILKAGKPEWRIESIKNDRIGYFRDMGLDLGNQYDYYLLSEDVKRMWPSVERVAKFQESRDRILNEFNILYYSSSPAHKKAREEIANLHFLDKDDSFNASIYATSNNNTFVNPNLVRTQDGYRLYPIVAINCNSQSGSTDHDIIHELNHLYELFLENVNENSYEVICGWDAMSSGINQKGDIFINTLEREQSKRPYELFNEIINELIAQEINEMMIQDHKHIFDREGEAVNKNTTSYEYTFFIVRDFFQEYKEDIIKSRNNGNIQIIWDKVGKENFDELNDLFHIFYKNFGGFKVYSLFQELEKKEDTPQTRKYHEIQEKRDKILDRMRKYSMTHTNETSIQPTQPEAKK